MDPVTAFAFAGTVIQFVSFGGNLISAAHELQTSASGQLAAHKDIESITKSLQKLVISIKNGTQVPEGGGTATISELQGASAELATDCDGVATDLLGLLDTLKMRKRGYLTALRKTLQSLRKDDKIRAIELKLQHFTQQLILSLIHNVSLDIKFVRKHQASLFSQVADIEVKTRALGKDLLDQISDSNTWRDELIAALHNSLPGREQNAPCPEPTEHKSLSEEAANHIATQVFLSHLRFAEISDREVSISQSAKNTFGWIYREAENRSVPWDSFIRWLEQPESGLYWITGKAGSGKSTLTRYIYYDPRTEEHLLDWNNEKELVKASFFFWNSGSQIQMSMLGMLRSLLFQILSKQPHLLPMAFPTRWNIWRLFEHDKTPWTWDELATGLERVITHASTTHNFFFIIDGLDEFDGDHPQLIEWLLKLVSQSRNIKVCAASRPWVDFEDAFKDRPNLMLQNLTRADIRTYVETNFSRNQGFKEFREQKRTYADSLLEKIINKADGVFLWVILVVRSLLRGLSDGDRISDLDKRLNELPGDLEGLFNKMLASVDKIYLPQTSRLFRLVQAAHTPLTILRMSLADEDEIEFALTGQVTPFSNSDLLYRCRSMKRRINSRCKGLLEVVSTAPFAGLSEAEKNGQSQQSSEECWSLGPVYSLEDEGQISGGHLNVLSSQQLSGIKVQFLHRTVRDFLATPQLRTRLANMDASSFDPQFSLSMAYLCQLKGSRDISKESFWDIVAWCLAYAHAASEARRPVLIRILDELNRVGAVLSSRSLGPPGSYEFPPKVANPQEAQPQWTQTLVPWMSGLYFTYLLAMCNIYWYFDESLRTESSTYFETSHRPLLLATLWDYRNIPSDWPRSLKQTSICTQTIQFLLANREKADRSGANHPLCIDAISTMQKERKDEWLRIKDICIGFYADEINHEHNRGALVEKNQEIIERKKALEASWHSREEMEIDDEETGIQLQEVHKTRSKRQLSDDMLQSHPQDLLALPDTWSQMEEAFGLTLDRFEGRPMAVHGGHLDDDRSDKPLVKRLADQVDKAGKFLM